jgi:ribosomal protein S18 acetylase RimI-like enzyme
MSKIKLEKAVILEKKAKGGIVHTVKSSNKAMINTYKKQGYKEVKASDTNPPQANTPLQEVPEKNPPQGTV